MLKKILHYNDVSKELIASIPKLKKGEIAKFKSLSIRPDDKSPRKFRGPFIENITTKDVIWDKHKQEFVEIAFCDQAVTNKGDSYAIFKTIKFMAPTGEITCRGGVADEEYLYYFLMLTNQNISNEDRDVSRKAYFQKVDREKEAKEKRKERNKRFDALTKATSMSPEEVRDFISATGGNDRQDLDILRNIVEEWADKHPEDFLQKTSDVLSQLKATVKRALDQGVIRFDKEQMRFFWGTGSEEILSVSRSQDGDHIREFAEICASDKRYEKVLPTIRKSLKK